MRMKVHLGILLLIGSLLAQPGPGMGMDGPPPGKNIEAMRIWRLTEVLELNEDQVTTFIPLLQIQERKIRDLQDEIDKLGNAGYELLQQEKVSQKEVDKLMQRMKTGWDSVCDTMDRLDAVRAKAHEIDEITWRDGLVRGYENHLYLVSCSDMEGDPEAFEDKLEGFLEEFKTRDGGSRDDGRDGLVRLGYVGVPPIAPEIYDYLESMGARVVYNETQRQFSLPFDTRDLVEKYLLYSYPYSIFYRLTDIERELEKRKLDGVLHYVQSFCFRQVEDIILRRSLRLPVLTVELDHSTRLDARTRMRLENFVSMLKGKGEA